MMDWPTVHEIARIFPTATLSAALIYFGWWLRGHQIKTLEQWIKSLKNDQ